MSFLFPFIRISFVLGFVLTSIACGNAQSSSNCSYEAAAEVKQAGFSWIAGGFKRPVGISHAGDGSSRLFVTEQGGCIYIIKNGKPLTEAFLDVQSKLSQGGERGLLGLAFHPDYQSNGRFFINYTNKQGNTVIAEYRVSGNPDKANAQSEKILLSFEQPFGNHNGGHLAFSPKDRYLYIATGDGGDGGDPRGYGQALYSPLGKLLRIDVDSASPYAIPSDNPWANSPDAVKEIWAYGLRNPWRFSFDRVTGDLYIGDVGQNAYEEINFQTADSKGGENYGWNIMEASHCFKPRNDCSTENLVLPIAEYDHSAGISVTGGYVYRGTFLPEMQGHYFYGDFARGVIWHLERQGEVWLNREYDKTPFQISSFGEDEAGELYLAHYGGGSIYRLGD